MCTMHLPFNANPAISSLLSSNIAYTWEHALRKMRDNLQYTHSNFISHQLRLRLLPVPRLHPKKMKLHGYMKFRLRRATKHGKF